MVTTEPRKSEICIQPTFISSKVDKKGKGKDPTQPFTTKVIGKNKLGDFLPEMFKAANIDTLGKKISGHSGRVSLCTSLYNADVQTSTVKKRSGHTSSCVELYMREDMNNRKKVSDLLQACVCVCVQIE